MFRACQPTLNDKVKSIDVDPEVGICYSDENKVPTYNDFKKELGSTMQDYSFTIMDFLALLIIAVLMSNSLMRSIIVPSIPLAQ